MCDVFHVVNYEERHHTSATVSRTRKDRLDRLVNSGCWWEGKVLSRTDLRHVMVLAQPRQVLIELLDPLLMGLDAFALKPLVKLCDVSTQQHEDYDDRLRLYLLVFAAAPRTDAVLRSFHIA